MSTRILRHTNGEGDEWGNDRMGKVTKEEGRKQIEKKVMGGGIEPTTKRVKDLARIGVLTTMPQRPGAIWATTCPYVNTPPQGGDQIRRAP